MILWRLTKDLWRWQLYLMPAIFLWPVREQYQGEGEPFAAGEVVTFWLCFGLGKRAMVECKPSTITDHNRAIKDQNEA